MGATIMEQRIADHKRTILIRHLQYGVKIGEIKILVNNPPGRIIETLENASNEEIFEAVIENVGAGKERKRGHNASRKVFC